MKTYAIVAVEPQPQTAEDQEQQSPCSWQTMALFGAIMVVFYLLLIRPQQRKQKDAERRKKEMLGSLKKNDHVLTIGGIHGVVTNVGEDEVAVRVDDKTGACVRISRDAISRVVGDEGEDEEKASGETK